MSWVDVQKIGFGELRLLPREFYRFTMQQFIYKLQGQREHEWSLQKEQWEMVRALAYENAMMAGKMLKNKMTVYRYWPFPWDKKKGIAAITSKEEQKKAINELRAAYLKAARISKN